MKTIYFDHKHIYVKGPFLKKIKSALSFILPFIFFQFPLISQTDSTCGIIKVILKDKNSNEAIPFANVVVYDFKNIQKAVATTNMDGEAIIKNIAPGKYNVKGVYVGYKAAMTNNVQVKAGKTTYLNMQLSNGECLSLQEVEVVTYAQPLIDSDTKSGATITREDYQFMSTKNINSVAATSQGVFSKNNNIRGGRSNSLNYSTISVNTYNSPPLDQKTNEETLIKAGVLTVGEINDFTKWDIWKEYSEPQLSQYSKVWELTPGERYVLQAINENNRAIIDAEVSLIDSNEEIIWKARTDNTGKAELWNTFYGEAKKASAIIINYKSKSYRKENIRQYKNGINFITINELCEALNNLDILFMVDATGSMSDEINYLKAELKNILETVSSENKGLQLNTASLFYRCVGNSYTTKVSEFTRDISKTVKFIEEQDASEGGLESVEIALEEVVTNFSWSKTGAARLLFIVMDEPPGNDLEKLNKLHKSIRLAAEKGIRIIPLIASGGTETEYDQKSMEYLMRCMALATNGTYAFLTDHSGVGLTHDKPKTNEYTVEYMNKLMLRIIKQFSTSACNDPVQDFKKDTVIIKAIDHVILDSVILKKTIASRENVVKTKNEESDLSNSKTEKQLLRNSLKYFPNPCRGELTIEISGKRSEVFLSDINGKILERYSVEEGTKLIIHLENYPAAIYNLKFYNGEEWLSGKLIKISD